MIVPHFPTVINGILSTGYTATMIATEVKFSGAHISRIKDGSVMDPCFSLGASLIVLYKRRYRGMDKSLYPKL